MFTTATPMPKKSEQITVGKTTIRSVLAQRLRALRSERGWTQTQLAEAADLHRTYISSIERGRRNVGLDNVERIAQAFGISVRDLLTEDALR